MEIVFDQKGTFNALEAARQWCRDNGVSYGSSCAMSPTGLLRGDYCIAKWRNLTPKERKQLDGTMSGDMREGPVTIRLRDLRSEEHTSELQSLMRISYAVFCLKKKTPQQHPTH